MNHESLGYIGAPGPTMPRCACLRVTLWEIRLLTSRNAVSLKGSKLPKLSRLVYVVEVILFYML